VAKKGLLRNDAVASPLDPMVNPHSNQNEGYRKPAVGKF